MLKTFSTLSILALVAATAMAQRALPTLNGEGYPFDINNSGTIVGATNPGPASGEQPMIWDVNGARLLGDYPFGKAAAINDLGQIVGFGTFDFAMRYPLVWNEEIPTELPDLGFGGEALAINNAGTIVGFVYFDSGNGSGWSRLPCKWEDGELTLLGLSLWESTFSNGVATSIGETGRIGGSVDRYAVYWEGDVAVGLGNPFDQFNTFLTNISRTNEMAANGFPGRWTFGWTPDNVFRSYPNVGGTYNTIQGGSPNGLLVGTVNTGVNVTTAATWSNGTLDLLPTPAGLTDAIAISANDRNQVVGIAYGAMGGYPVIWDFDPLAPVLDIRNEDSIPGMMTEFRASVTRDGAPASNVEVTFTTNGVVLGRAVSNASGVATLNARLPLTFAAGDRDLVASLGGTRQDVGILNVHLAGSVLVPTTISAQPGQAVTLQAILRNSPSGQPLTGQRVQMTLPGANRATTVSTNAQGQGRIGWRVPTSATAGTEYRIPVSFGGNAGHRRAAAVVVVTVR
jgi:hypothetical protein